MIKLEKRRLGRTEMRPNVLALGCASLHREDRTDAETTAAVRRAIELGWNYLDTSPLYGESERRLGLALQGGWREKIFLQTKTGTHPKYRYDYSAKATQWSVENSLKLMKTEYLDAVLIHDPSDIEDPLRHLLVVTENVSLFQHRIHERRLAVIDVGDDGDVSDVFTHLHRYS